MSSDLFQEVNWSSSKVHPLPDCVFLKLKTVPIAHSTALELFLTIRFGLQHSKTIFSADGGQWSLPAYCGISRGVLSLKLGNGCKLITENVDLSPPLDREISVEKIVEMTDGQEIKASVAPSGKKSGGKKWSHKFMQKHYQVATSGTEESPTWFFEAPDGEILQGTLFQLRLGVLMGDVVRVREASFKVEESSFTLVRRLDLANPRSGSGLPISFKLQNAAFRLFTAKKFAERDIVTVKP